jgi:glycerol uptake facilitator-like aquaporin
LQKDVDKLVNSFTFEPEYSLPDNTFDGKEISFSIYLYILLGTFLFSILAFICSMVWRKNSKNGNQKLASEMLASFFVALLFYMFKILKNPAIIKKGWPFLLGNCIGECIGTSLLIFFIFFFWSWKKQFIQIHPAKIIVKTLCIIIIIAFSWFTLSSLINFLQTCGLTEILYSILLIILIVLIVRKYMQLFTHQNNQAAEHIERENLENH